YHLRDIYLQLRTGDEKIWKKYNTATQRSAVKILPISGRAIAAADLAPSLPINIPLQVKRFWELESGQLILRFELKNISSSSVEIGALGIPMIFNNILEGKTLERAHADNVFYDPYIGQDAGYLQVARLSGQPSTLVVTPYGKTPFEAYNPLLDDPTPRSIVFEGFYEWVVHSKAYAETDWKNAEQWNNPTSIILRPGETQSYGLKFLLSGTVRHIEHTLIANNIPVAISVPGYVLPQDVDAKLFIKYNKPVKSITIEPRGSLTVTTAATTKEGWRAYVVKGNTWGRVRLSVKYDDGLTQTINYKVIKSETEVIAAYGNFLTTKQWFNKPDPIFKRSPSAITYDYETKQQVTQDPRAWIAGLSDEGGAGSWLGAIMKQLVSPVKSEVDKLQTFVDTVMFGRIQIKEGDKKYGVKKSLFYYEPDSLPKGTYNQDINFKTWSAWPRKEADNLGRSYNYPHVAAAHWILYRLARHYKGLVEEKDWSSHLINAAETGLAMGNFAPYYAQFGQMEGTIFFLILKDLRNEGLSELADKLEIAMKKRADHWRSLQYPFGSEMPWDSTGQEEVYIWSKHFGYTDKARVTLDAILAYMPVVPHWAYHGNARRYWDFLYGGKLSRIERMIHHYGSALNAIPLLMEYRDSPHDFHLLRAGYGGLMGAIANITEDGFAPTAFHAFPATLKNDGISGDYGSGFFGYAVNTSSYLIHHHDFGWLGFGGNVTTKGKIITFKLTTAAKSAVYIAPLGLWITLDAGQIEEVSCDSISGEVNLKLKPADLYTPTAFIRIAQPAKLVNGANYRLSNTSFAANGRYAIQLAKGTSTAIIVKNK
ncbi:MAG: DUF5695 domain-containing protein, partial [Bacteroidia bacterium]